jgi:hypothetical protein
VDISSRLDVHIISRGAGNFSRTSLQPCCQLKRSLEEMQTNHLFSVSHLSILIIKQKHALEIPAFSQIPRLLM